MATHKVTFTLDDAAVGLLRDAAERLSLPKSEIVREAIVEFHDRIGRLSERERVGMLRVLDEMAPKSAARTAPEVDRELAEIRRARKGGGRAAGMRP